MAAIVPTAADPNVVELCKNLIFASYNKECNSASELLQKVVALKCIQESTMLRTFNILPLHQSSETPSCSSSPILQNLPISFISSYLSFPIPLDSQTKARKQASTNNENPSVCFESLTAVVANLRNAAVDPYVAEQIALEHLSTQDANPHSFMSKTLLDGKSMFPLDDITTFFIKSVLKRLHNSELFTPDGGPYPFDVKSALRYSEHLHSQIPDLRSISPPHLAHEQSITLAAMARFMAMHEIVSNIDLRLLFPVETNVLEEHAYCSALFWTYREAFKTFCYPAMPAPFLPAFKMTMPERKILNRYWNAGNRHITATEAEFLSRRCPNLSSQQINGYFEKRRRQQYNKYRFLKDAETLAKETAKMGKVLKEMKTKAEDDSDDEEGGILIQREFLSKADKAKLQAMWQLGHRNPSRNECELLAAENEMSSGEQIFAYFEDRRWRLDYQQRKLKASASKKKKKKKRRVL